MYEIEAGMHVIYSVDGVRFGTVESVSDGDPDGDPEDRMATVRWDAGGTTIVSAEYLEWVARDRGSNYVRD